jgi:hypothetical protein
VQQVPQPRATTIMVSRPALAQPFPVSPADGRPAGGIASDVVGSLVERRWARLAVTAVLGALVITVVAAVTSQASPGTLAILAGAAVAVFALLLGTAELGARKTRARVTGIDDPTTAWRLTHDVERGRVPVDEAWWPAARQWATYRTRRRIDDLLALGVLAVLAVAQLVGAVVSGDVRNYVIPVLIAGLVALAWTARRRTQRNLRTVLEVVGAAEGAPADA